MSHTKEGLFLQRLILISFHLLIFLTPFIWTPSLSELFEFPKMLYVYAATILITTLWVARSLFDHHRYLKRTPFDLPILIFLSSQFLATIFSINIHTSIFGYYSRFHGGLLSYLCYSLLFYGLVNNLERRHIKNLTITLLSAATLTSLYSFPEHYGHSPSCALITGEFNATCWVQDVQTRVFGTFGQPNWQAAYLLTVFFIPVSFLVASLKDKNALFLTLKNVSLLFLTSLFFTVLLFTKSRSGFLGLACGTIVFFLGLLASTSLRTQRSLRTFVGILVLLASLAAIFGRDTLPQFIHYFPQLRSDVSISNPTPVVTPVTGTQLESGGTESGDIRRIVWAGTLELFHRYPLFGSGTETFAYAYYNVRPVAHNLVSEWDFLYNKAHNELLNFLSTTGIIGLAAYLLVLIWLFVWWCKDIRSNKSSAIYSLAFVSGLTALTVSNTLGFSTVAVTLLLFLMPAMSVTLLHAPQTKLSQSSPMMKSWIGVTLVGMLGLLMLYQVTQLYTADLAYTRGKASLSAGLLPEAISELQLAASTFPSEPVYTEQLSFAIAQAAALLHQGGQATDAASLAVQAIAISDLNMSQNPVHLNFIKTRVRLFITLSVIDPEFVHQAIENLNYAISLAPTDPKLIYNLGLLYEQLEEHELAEKYYLQSIELKPNYDTARVALAGLYERTSRYDDAYGQYEYILNQLKPGDAFLIQQINRLATISGTIN